MSAPSQRTAFKPPAAEILMFAGEAVMAADENGRVLLCNRAAEEIFGYAPEEILGLPIERLMVEPAPEARWQPTHGRGQGLAPEWTALVESRRMAGQRKHGGEFPVEATLSRREIEGHMVMIAVVRDATERDAERLLVRELEHRMKNALAAAQALAVQTIRSSPTPEVFINAFGRLATLAYAHSLLLQHHQDSVPLHQLVTRQLAPYRSAEPERVVVAGEAVVLRSEAALGLNMVLHELATNAAKHGALSVPEGCVAVSWRVEGTASGRRLVLGWVERGGPEDQGHLVARHARGVARDVRREDRAVHHLRDRRRRAEGIRGRVNTAECRGWAARQGFLAELGPRPRKTARTQSWLAWSRANSGVGVEIRYGVPSDHAAGGKGGTHDGAAVRSGRAGRPALQPALLAYAHGARAQRAGVRGQADEVHRDRQDRRRPGQDRAGDRGW